MIFNRLRINLPIIIGSVLALVFTLGFGISTSVSAQNEPDYLLGNLTLKNNLTKEETQEIGDKITNYLSTMQKAANGNETKFSILLIEDLAKRNIIDEDAKQGFLSFIAKTPKPPVEGLPGTLPGNLTIPGNTDFLKDLDTSSTLLDDIAKNNSDSQTVTLMTDILKKRVTDIGNLVSGNVTDTGMVPIEGEFNDVSPGDFAKAVTCAGMFVLGGNLVSSVANGYYCVNALK